ncbi:unnamed protein product [Amoebophrya sp. A120]|nr:unnamed protein product [Amoebophrya sp. A120]|eukprot:GSA120T00018338001.1
MSTEEPRTTGRATAAAVVGGVRSGRRQRMGTSTGPTSGSGASTKKFSGNNEDGVGPKIHPALFLGLTFVFMIVLLCLQFFAKISKVSARFDTTGSGGSEM